MSDYTDAHRLAQTLAEQRDGMDGTTQATGNHLVPVPDVVAEAMAFMFGPDATVPPCDSFPKRGICLSCGRINLPLPQSVVVDRARQRIATLGLVDGLTASPSDVEGFLAECIADYRALQERHGRAMNQSLHFWLSSFLMVLEDIQKRYRLEQAQRHAD